MEHDLEQLAAEVRSRHPAGGPLEHLADAVLAAQDLNRLADALIGRFVDEARGAGASWTEIGQSLGVTKQAAQKRFVPRSAGLAKYTDRAQRAIVASQAEARRAGQANVAGEHIVLGLIDEPDSLAARAIEAMGVPLSAARSTLATVGGPPAQNLPDHIPYSGEAKKIRELAVREALRLGHVQIGTDDILLAVVRDGRCAAARALAGLGVKRDRTERCLRELASPDGPRE